MKRNNIRTALEVSCTTPMIATTATATATSNAKMTTISTN